MSPVAELKPDGAIKENIGSSNELDYVQTPTPTTPITVTTEATATVILTGNNITYDGSKVKISVEIPLIQITVANAKIVVFRDAVAIGQFVVGQGNMPFFQEMYDTPAAGNHIYSVKAFTAGANNLNLSAGAGGPGNLTPAYLRVSRAV